MLPNNFTPMNANSLLIAQVISHVKGQENQSRESSEKKERERVDTLVLKQVETHQNQNKTPNMQKGILA